jgi:hypothetical protein
MFGRFRLRLSYANVMATIAMFLALGGGAAVARGVLVKSSKQVATGAINSGDLKNGKAVKLADFSPTALNDLKKKLGTGAAGPQGAKGETGSKGAQGDPGTPATRLWAVVNANGTLKRGSSADITVSNLSSAQYLVTFPESVQNCAFIGTTGAAANASNSWGSPPEDQINVSYGEVHTGSSGTVVVETANAAGTLTAADFHLAVFC